MKTRITGIFSSCINLSDLFRISKIYFVRVLKHLLPVLLLMFPLSALGDEEVLRLLVWEGFAPKKYVEDFEKQIEAKYGRKVKMKISYVHCNDDFYDPVRNKSVDVVTMTHHIFKDERFNYIENKLLLPLDLKNIPNFKYVIPALQKSDQLSSDGEIYGSFLNQGKYELAYNIKMFKHEPDSWKIFWDPKLEGKYTIGAKEYMFNANITALALGYPRDLIGSFDALNNNEFKEKLRQLAVNAHSFWIGIDKADDLFGLSLAASWGESLVSLKKRGEIWRIVEPKEGMPRLTDAYAITWALADKPFLKTVAEEWINRVLESDFQVGHIVRKLNLYPVITNIGNKLTKEEKERIQIRTPGSFRENQFLQQNVSQRDRNGLKLLWDEAMKGISIE